MSTFQHDRLLGLRLIVAILLVIIIAGTFTYLLFLVWGINSSFTPNEIIPIVAITLAVSIVSYGISYFISAVRWRQADAIVKGSITPATTPPAVPLTDHEKIDALYKLSRTQSRDQLISNAIWAVVGIVGGYFASHYLPHLHL
jgi:hypothetical protein